MTDAGKDEVVRIALTRHGQTDWNAHGRLQGSSDVPLNEVGRSQASDSAARFDRGAETGRIIADALGVRLHGTYTDLVERDYGEAEGVTDVEAATRWPDGDFPGMEPRSDVAERGLLALDAIAAELPGERVVVVAHGTLIREILRRMTTTPIPPILNAATSVVERTRDGWRVVTVNDEELSAITAGGSR